MGFGLLFIGYLVGYLFSLALSPLKLVGCIVMLVAVKKLSEYNTRFKLCYAPLGILCLFGAYSILQFILERSVIGILSMLEVAVDAAFYTCLLTAVCAIAKETELPKYAYKAMRNLYIALLYVIARFAVLLIPEGTAANVMGNMVVIAELLIVVLNLLLFANCYRLICSEDEVDMPIKESKIPLIRKMDAVMNKREEEAMQAAQRLKEKQQSKRKNKNKKKK